MHLMVLGAPRQGSPDSPHSRPSECLNAPDGTGCSPTRQPWISPQTVGKSLNAPDGAGCPLTAGDPGGPGARPRVSMHLMVLGAP